MDNASIRDAARQLFPGGVNSPVRSFRSVGGGAIPIVRGDGGDPGGVREVTIGFQAVPALLAGRVAAATGFWNAEGVALIIIEHNVEFIAAADHVIDMGPGGGEAGGRVVACGTPEEIAENPSAPTGPYLRRVLGKTRRRRAKRSAS